jgi:hypothetical protein
MKYYQSFYKFLDIQSAVDLVDTILLRIKISEKETENIYVVEHLDELRKALKESQFISLNAFTNYADALQYVKNKKGK